VELKIDDGKPAGAPDYAPSSSAPALPKRQPEGSTMVMSRGVSLTDLEHGGTRPSGFDTNTVFSKKKKQGQHLLHYRRHHRWDCHRWPYHLRAFAGQHRHHNRNCGQ